MPTPQNLDEINYNIVNKHDGNVTISGTDMWSKQLDMHLSAYTSGYTG
jgi:hypothetical protein